ncbi:MAG: MgtC/SapB family protein [Christensenellaceae bacterium]|nr:MgtC/SapB family protein [Christensenellaceae bacterium]
MAWWVIGLRMLLAVSVGCVIGVERERKNRPAGMRTHVLVCVGAAMIALMDCLNADRAFAYNLLGQAEDMRNTGVAISVGRMSAQVVSGIGFLGAGTIFIAQKKIAGLTTAASLWASACLGLAAGMGYYLLVILGCGLVMGTLTVMQRVVHVNQIKNLEVKYVHRQVTQPLLASYFEEKGVRVMDVNFHMEVVDGRNVYTNLYTIDLPNHTAYRDVIVHLSENENILGVRTRNV